VFKRSLVIFFLVLSISLPILANSKKDIEAKLISDTLSKLFNYKLKIYTESKYAKEIISMSSGKLEFVPNCKDSDLVIGDELPKNCDAKMCLFFTYNYEFLKKYDNVLGGLFWAKNRVKLIFIKERLEKHGITIPDELKKYIEYLEYL